MLTDGRTDGRTHGRTDDGRKVITIAHPEQSSGELKNGKRKFLSWRIFRESVSRSGQGRHTHFILGLVM